MKNILIAELLAFIASLGFMPVSFAQQANVRVVAACGSLSPYGSIGPGTPYSMTMDPSGNLCTAASVSASINGFTPTPSYATLSASDTANHSVATPTGPDEVITNKDTNIAYCNFGAASTTSTMPIIGGQAIGVHFGGSVSTIQCQSPSSSLNITIAGGTGLFTGAGGGGGGGGSGGVVQQGAPNSLFPWYVQPGGGAIFPTSQSGNWTNFTANSNGTATLIAQSGASVPINISTATTTQLVALSAGKSIYVTAWDVIAGGTGNFTLEYGTGSNCGTGTTALTGTYGLVAQFGISKGSGLGPVLIVPAGNALCALTSAAVQMSGSVAYSQF